MRTWEVPEGLRAHDVEMTKLVGAAHTSRSLRSMRALRHSHSPSLQHLVAATSGLAVLRVGDFAIRTQASLRVAAPVDAAAGVGNVELAPRVDEHLLTSEQPAVFLGNSDVTGIVGHKQPSCDCALG